MNSMHNSFNGPGGYSGTYSGYVPPPSALPYYNGYAGETNQCSTPYYGKPAASTIPPNYGIATYASSVNNSSMYYQQYGMGYQYGYSKYGMGYPGDASAHHPNMNTMQPSAATDLGPIGSMFSKNKFSDGQSSSSPQSGSLARNQSGSSILSPSTSNTPSPGPQNMSLNFKGAIATPSPPVDVSEGKKDLDKMKKCHICGQVFQLMSECLAHVKAVHDNPSDSYMHHMINQGQPPLPGSGLPNPPVASSLPHPPTRFGAPLRSDSPLTALEKMGWTEKQTASPTMNQVHNQLPLVAPANSRGVQEYGAQYRLQSPSAHPVQRMSSPSAGPNPALGANPDRNSMPSTSSHLESPTLKAQQLSTVGETAIAGDAKQRKSTSYSVSSIMGEAVSMNHCLQRKFPSINDFHGTASAKIELANKMGKMADEIPKPMVQTMSNVTNNPDIAKPVLPIEKKDNISDITGELILPAPTIQQESEVSFNDGVKTEGNSDNAHLVSNEQTENRTTSTLPEPEVKVEPKEPKIQASCDTLKQEQDDTSAAGPASISEHTTEEIGKITEDMNDAPEPSMDKNNLQSGSIEKCSNESIQSNSEEPDNVKTSQEVDKPLPNSNLQQMAHTQHYRPAHPMSNVYVNSAGKQANFPNWPMNVSSGYPGHYPYPTNQPNHSGMDGCIKPHGYAMQPRYPVHYQQNQMCGRNACGPTHPRDHNAQGFTQNHSQNPPSGWYPNNSRNDGKPMWSTWPTQSGGAYNQGFYGYPSGASAPQGQKAPGHIHPLSTYPASPQQTPVKVVQQIQNIIQPQAALHIPPKMATPTPSSTQPLGNDLVKKTPFPDSPSDDFVPKLEVPNHSIAINLKQVENDMPPETQLCNQYDMEKLPNAKPPTGCVRKPGVKIGPKSKTMSAKQLNLVLEQDNYNSIDHQHDIDGEASQSATSQYDSSDSEVVGDEGPTYAILKPLRKRNSISDKDGVFVGPKRIKLAKLVQARQTKRHRHIQEQIHQNEIEERLQAERAEKLTDQDGPLANIILQSSIILADKSSTSSNPVEIFMASMNADREKDGGLLPSETSSEKFALSPYVNSVSFKRSLNKKLPDPKIFHNENSVLIKHPIHGGSYMKKLRAKDFKWSHYIKTTRFWCNDCAQGFKNQKEANAHTEDKCKLNCLYMLECYVVVKDVQSHPEYGSKVQVLLEEYQIDGNHTCSTCGDVIARKADFVVHTDTHKDFMPWECTICGTRFKIRGSLKEHLRYTHMKGRVPCLKCNKVFPTSTLLRQHVKVHTQHYKYKSGKNRKDELRVAMEATAGAIEPGMASPEESDRLSSQEANEYRSWCKLMEMNAMKNIATYGTGLSGTSFANNFDEDFDEKDDGNMSGDDLNHLDVGHGEPNDSMSS